MKTRATGLRRLAIAGLGIFAAAACTEPGFEEVPVPRIVPATLPPAPPVLGISHQESGAVSILDTSTRRIVATIAVAEKVGAITLSADGSRLFASVPAGIAVVDVKTRQVVRTIAREGTRSSLLSAGDLLYVTEEATSENDRVAVIDLRNDSVKAERLIRTLSRRAELSGDGLRLFIAHSFYTGIVTSLRTADLARTGETRHEDGASRIRLSPDDRTLYVPNGMNDTGRLGVVDVMSRTLVEDIPLTSAPSDIVVAPDGSRAYISLSRENLVTVVDLTGRRVERSIAVADVPGQIALSPDGGYAFVLHDRGEILTVIDLKTDAVSTEQLDRGGDGFAVPSRR